MELEQALELVNFETSQQIGRSLSEVEIALFKGAWENENYEQIADKSGYSLNYLQRDIGPKFWKLLSQIFNRKLSKINLRGVFNQFTPLASQSSSEPAPILQQPIPSSHLIDWGESIDIDQFYGRTEEIATLKQWLIDDRCRLTALLGMGGIGKSSLAAKIGHELQPHFDFVIWRSLRNAPPLETLLADVIPFLSQHQDNQYTLDRLLYWLREFRCFVILDNAETILQSGNQAGNYLPNYENYGELLRLVGETTHQSCILLTSREKPREIATFETPEGKVRSLSLQGSWEAALALIEAKELSGTLAEKQQLCRFYNCSPLALKIIASSIQSLFDGDIAAFLAEETLVFNGLRRLLDQHFDRLSHLEKTILYWLAINRGWTTISELSNDIVPNVAKANLLEALESLAWRNLIEKRIQTHAGKAISQYTQQPVVMEYVTENLTQQIATEIINCQPALLYHHALLKTTALEYLRASQIRLILQPIVQHLIQTMHNLDGIQSHFQVLLDSLQKQDSRFFDYSIGNLMNLGLHLNLDLARYDWSHRKIRQVDFQGKQLSHLNLAHTTLRDCLFTQNFGAIFAVAFSHDSQMLAIGDSGGIVRLWSLRSHPSGCLDLEQPHGILRGHSSWIYSVAWHPNRKQLISSSDDRTLKLWDTETGQCLSTFQGHQGAIWRAVWSPDGEQIASCSSDHTIKRWNAHTGECLQTYVGHENLVWSIDWHPDGRTLLSGSDDRTIKLWDVETGTCEKTLTIEQHWIRCVLWHPDGQTFAIASSDRAIYLWHRHRDRPIQTLRGHSSWIYALAWSPDGKTLASCSSDATIRLWDPHNGNCLKTLTGHQQAIWNLHWSADGTTLVGGDYDQTIRLWNAHTGQCHRVLKGHINWIRNSSWSPTGSHLTSSSTDNTAKIWDMTTGQCQTILKGHQGWVYTAVWHPTQPLIASGGTDNLIKLWQAETGRCLRTLTGHASWIWSVAWHPDGKTLASGSSTNDQTIRIWDTESGDCLNILTGHQSWIWWVVWSPDGKTLASAGNDRLIKLWDAATGECLKTLHDDRTLGIALAWSPDGKTLASSSTDAKIKLWLVKTGQCERELAGHSGLVWAIAWSPDGEWMASAAADGTVRIWRSQTGECIHTLLGHQHRIWHVAWSPCGRYLASSSSDETIRIWDSTTGDCWKVLSTDRPYEGMNITDITGMTEAQKSTLKALGAIASGS